MNIVRSVRNYSRVKNKNYMEVIKLSIKFGKFYDGNVYK